MTITTTRHQGADLARRLDLHLFTRGRIVVIGQGGIGSILSRYLILFLSGLGERFRIVLCDGDAWEEGNLYRADVPSFENKAVANARHFQQVFPRPGLTIRAVDKHLGEANAADIIRDGDVVFLCLDNHASRKLASDRFNQLSCGILISGGNDGVDEHLRGTAGNIQVHVREGGKTVAGAALDRFHPEIADPEDRHPDALDCMQGAALVVLQLLPVNLMAACMMLNAGLRMLMPVPGERMYDEACFDILDARAAPIRLTKGESAESPS